MLGLVEGLALELGILEFFFSGLIFCFVTHLNYNLPSNKLLQYFLDYPAAVGTWFSWTGTDNQKRTVNFNPTGNVMVFGQPSQKKKKKVVETRPNEGNHLVPN